MEIVQAIAILGPLVEALGAGLLAYGVLRTPASWMRHEYFGRRSWDLLQVHHVGNVRRLESLPVPPYSKEQVNDLIAEAEASFQDMKHTALDRNRDDEYNGLLRMRRLALGGLMLVMLGSILQATAAALAA